MPTAIQDYMPLMAMDRFCSAAHTTIATLTATTRKVAWVVQVPPGYGFDKVGLVINANTGSASFRISVQSLSSLITPSGTILNGVNSPGSQLMYADVATGYTTGNMIQVTLGDRIINNTSAPITYAIVFEYNTGTAWAAGVHADPRYGSTRYGMASIGCPMVLNNVGSWAKTATVRPVLYLLDSVTGKYVPGLCSATQATSQVCANTVSLQYGNRWDVKFRATVGGVRMGWAGNASGGSFNLNVFKNNVLVNSTLWTNNNVVGVNATQGVVDLPLSTPFSVIPGDVVYMFISGQSLNGGSFFGLTFTSNAMRQIMFDNVGVYMKGATADYSVSLAETGDLGDSVNGNVVTDINTTVYPVIPLLTGINSPDYGSTSLGVF